MPNVLIHSIPGSGTRFTAKFLEDCLGLELTSPESLLYDICRNKYGILHVGEHLKKATMIYGSDLKVIIPLRSPEAQYYTRRKTDKNFEQIRYKTIWQWSTLINNLHWFRDRYVFLPIETAHRRETLLSVIDLVGSTFDRSELNRFVEEWPRVGHNDNRPQMYDAGEMDAYLRFANEWYDHTMGAHDGRYS